MLAGCGRADYGRAGIDPALAVFAPEDSTVLAGVRMAAVRDTAVYQKMLARQQLTRLDNFARETGFDPRRDVRELLVASDGKDTIVAARGAFHIQPPEGATKTSYKGCSLYTRDEGSVAVVDDSTALAGSLTAVRGAIDRFKAGGRTGPSALLARAREIPSANQIWAVSNGAGGLVTGLPERGNSSNVTRLLKGLENTTAAFDLRTGVYGNITGVCATEQDAKKLGDAARGLIGLGRLSVPSSQPEMLRLWDGLTVDQQQRNVKIMVSIPQDLVDKLIDMLGKLPGNRRQPLS